MSRPRPDGYSRLTVADPNPVKRFIQRRRLTDAARIGLRHAPQTTTNLRVLDFGAGDGLLLTALRFASRNIEYTAYEPSAMLRQEAAVRLADTAGVRIVGDLAQTEGETFDIVFACEVFEHLPPLAASRALADISQRLAPRGVGVIGVPIEIGPPALAKGAFRLARRPSAFDGRLRGILAATFGKSTAARPEVEIEPGFAYYPYHLGFNHRDFRQTLRRRFLIQSEASSPLRYAPTWLNSEIYFVTRRCDHET